MQLDLTGQTLGKYRILRLLDAGGMGGVYEAEEQQGIARKVAIKILPPQLAKAPGYVERFQREVELVATLEHIHIVPIYDYGTHNDFTYVVMRLLTGGSLEKRLFTKQLSLPETQKLLGQVASALDYAHSHKIVHRDLKPANIMFDEQGNSYLTDFGIARVIGSTGLTQEGQAVGTAPYMSPEQWLGKKGIGAATDIYALGIVTYELLTGALPFEADTAIAFGHLHLNELPAPPSEKNSTLPPAVDAVLLQALAKDPADRYPSASAFVIALQEAIQGRPAQEITTSPIPSIRPPTPPPDSDSKTLVDTTQAPIRTAPLPTEVLKTTTKLVQVKGWQWALGAVILLGIVLGGWLLLGSSGEEGQQQAENNASSEALTLAQTGVSANREWTPHIEIFDGVEMVLVPQGCFQMGSDSAADEQPVHRVCINAFWLDRYEVTNEQFDRLAGVAAVTSRFTDPTRPRERITWEEARAFCEKRGGQLPSEAEWEYAARGPDNLTYPWGNEFSAEKVIFDGNSGGETAPVGSKPDGVSWVGALDLSGNVWEWTSTVYDGFSYPYKATDGRENLEDTASRTLRGGSWDSRFPRASVRLRNLPILGSAVTGFRCIRPGQ